MIGTRRGKIALLVGTALIVTGALVSLLAGAARGMAGQELRHMALLLAIAIVATAVVVLAAERLLAHRSLRSRFLTVGLLAVVVSLVNLGVLVLLMSVSDHDATLLAITLFYSLAAGAAAAFTVARMSSASVERVADVARRLGDGDLGARVGPIQAGPEIDTLAHTLDEMADRLQDSIERERAAEAQRRDLVTAVSHDLRTPLASLRAMVESIDDGIVEDTPTIRRYAAEMRNSIETLTQMVDDLFELVQLDAGAIEAEAKRAQLRTVIDSALAACSAQANEKGLQIEAEIDGAGEYLCSPRITRVLQNLLQNAIRHTPADGTVSMQARPCPTGIELVVEDSGEGISPEALEHVFEPFWRGDSARTSDGSGLGLALAKRIVEALGGQIEVASAPRHGARFAVTLPAG